MNGEKIAEHDLVRAVKGTKSKVTLKKCHLNRSLSAHYSDVQESQSMGEGERIDYSKVGKKIPPRSASTAKRLSMSAIIQDKMGFKSQHLNNSINYQSSEGEIVVHGGVEKVQHDDDSSLDLSSPKEQAEIVNLIPKHKGRISPITNKSQTSVRSLLSDYFQAQEEEKIVIMVNKRRFKLRYQRVDHAKDPMQEVLDSPHHYERDELVNKSLQSRSIISPLRKEGSIRHSVASSQLNMEGKRVINDYELQESIGSGSFGKVYKARHVVEKKLYVEKAHKAVKVLRNAKKNLRNENDPLSKQPQNVLLEIAICKKVVSLRH